MPLTGDIDTESGAVASYHVVDDILARARQDEVIITLSSYLDETAFTAGKAPVRSQKYTVQDQAFDNYFEQSVLKEQGIEPVSQAESYIVDNKSELTVTNG